uniref:DUF4378 domain-containing protein n=1 Tax=Lotus japonicus TaxID=34305 RepID=I3S7K9_LOTJA|nr:unknown [Lotus japonicus]
MKINLEEDSPKLDVPATKSSAETLRDTRVVADEVVDVVDEKAVGSSESSSDKDLSAGSSDGSSVSSKPLPGLESSCKDADQPSPISVLEPSCTDDLSSSSECFVGLSADLQGLRKQLTLLKLESEDYEEGPVLISNDEDGGETCTEKFEGSRWCRTEDSWESSYIMDALSESGFDGADPDTILEVWNSLECPMSISVFHDLEKRYCDWTTCSRSERRMLFDRINSGIFRIYEQSLCGKPWVGPATPDIGSQLTENGLQDSIERLLGRQREVTDDILGKLLVMESQWLDLGDDIDVIGSEIERLLFDELVAEIAGA